MTKTSPWAADDAADLEARVLAEPDASERARMMGVDLADLTRTRGRLLTGYWIIAVGMLLLLGTPIVISLIVATGDPGGWVGGFLVRELLGGVAVWFALLTSGQLAAAAIGHLPTAPARSSVAFAVAAAVVVPLALTVVVALSRHEPGYLVGAVAFAGLAQLLTFRTADLAAAIQANTPGTAAVVIAAREASDSVAGRIRWMLAQFASSALAPAGLVLLLYTAWWTVFPAALLSVVIAVIGERVFQRQGYPAAVAVQLGFSGLLFTAGLVFAGRLLLPAITFAPAVTGVPA